MLKRGFDITASALGLMVLSPLLLLIVLVIRLTSPGPVLYKATRTGRGGRAFTLYKFRSMIINAADRGPGITTSGDPRIIPIGRLLRRTELDELPQLWNVLRGDMNLVGPRPEDPRYVALYTPAQRAIFDMRPGITSLASLRYRNEETLLDGSEWETHYVQEILPAKLALDLDYARRATLWHDLLIILRTILSR
jgi:lipopolysaccharide/colanic/teichoic acid biosynthesis glycosyltransferase